MPTTLAPQTLAAQIFGDQYYETAEASALGWIPGFFPAQFIHPDGLTYVREHAERRDGDLLAVHYASADGAVKLVVFND